ncbi:hypothetical protein [Streptomyces sp. DH8]|uniref:hypothetical protein n=1 Tax=Streptomyces sp. DH8 TaxID=2857008 RepID=UPI001E4E7078|nr:hypothetical protein [Streptomyces sp. DH8]
MDARNTAFRALPLALSLVTSAVGALGNAIFMGGPPRLLPWAAGAGGYAVLAFVTTAAIGVGTVLGSQSGGAARRRWAPAP